MDKDKEFLDNEAVKVNEDEEKYVDEAISLKEDLVDEELRDICTRELRIKFISELFKEREDWQKSIFKLKVSLYVPLTFVGRNSRC